MVIAEILIDYDSAYDLAQADYLESGKGLLGLLCGMIGLEILAL